MGKKSVIQVSCSDSVTKCQYWTSFYHNKYGKNWYSKTKLLCYYHITYSFTHISQEFHVLALKTPFTFWHCTSWWLNSTFTNGLIFISCITCISKLVHGLMTIGKLMLKST